jgi:hypothetical protein
MALTLSAVSQSVDSVRAEIMNYGILEGEIVLRQSIEETGWYGCTDCSMDDNNIFGFRWKGEYLKFDTWQDCIRYYADWQDRHYKGGDYYEFLEDRGFATNPKYIGNLKSIKL